MGARALEKDCCSHAGDCRLVLCFCDRKTLTYEPYQGLDNNPTVAFERVYKDFARLVEKFQAENGRPAVLVIDNTNLIAQESPKTLHHLQDRARYAVDNALYKVLFVCSDGFVPALMKEKSFC